MIKKTKIPASIEKAEDRLAALDGIATATGWERAAIVYAFTNDGKPGPKGDQRGIPTISCTEFAGKGIVGLKDKDTVSHYRKSWLAAIAAGEAQDIKPGDTITLPDMDWPVAERNQGSRSTPSNIGKQMANNPKLLQAAVTAAAQIAPAVVAQTVAQPAVAAATVNDAKARSAVTKASNNQRAKDVSKSSMPRPKNTPTPKDDEADEISELSLALLLQEFQQQVTIAKAAGDRAAEIMEKIQRYVTDEQNQFMDDSADDVVAAWQMVQDLNRGIDDDELRDLANSGEVN